MEPDYDLIDEKLTELEDAISDLDEIDAASDFRDSLNEKCESMREQYVERGALTDAQLDAIDNMVAGARKWIH